MKKIYLQPEIDVVDIKFSQTLLAGSPVIDVYDDTIDDPGSLKAPELPGIPSAPGLPGMPSLFE